MEILTSAPFSTPFPPMFKHIYCNTLSYVGVNLMHAKNSCAIWVRKVRQQPDFRQELRRREREVEMIQSVQQVVFLEEGGQVGRRGMRDHRQNQL
jgi:phosphopantetheine adenylyltransferase